jgi:twinkle protein
LLEKFIGKPFNPGPVERINKLELSTGLKWLNQHFVFLDMPLENLTLIDILNEAKKWHASPQPYGLVIDPWNELDHRRPQGFTETEYISQSLSEVRHWARDFNSHVWLIAHPMKMQKDKDGTYPVPTPYDISGSAHWRNKADNCLCVWRDVVEGNEEVELHVQKIRFKHNGKIGMVGMRYNKVTGRYHEIGLKPVPYYSMTERDIAI